MRIRVSRGGAIVLAIGALAYLAYVFVDIALKNRAGKEQDAKLALVRATAEERAQLEKTFKQRETDAIVRCGNEKTAAFSKAAPNPFALPTTPPAKVAEIAGTRPFNVRDGVSLRITGDFFETGPVDCWPQYPADVFTPGVADDVLAIENLRRRDKVLAALHPADVIAGYDMRCAADKKTCEVAVVWVSTKSNKVLAAIHVTPKAKQGNPDGVQLGADIGQIVSKWGELSKQ